MLLVFLSSLIVISGGILYDSKTVPSYSTLRGKLTRMGDVGNVEINQVDYKINDRKSKNIEVKTSIEILVKKL